jgi:hypothetical protein
MAPATGLPISTPIEEKEYRAPLRTPRCRGSDIFATMAGIIDRVHPEVYPYRIAYTIWVAVVLAGSHTAKVKTPASIVCIIMTLKTP